MAHANISDEKLNTRPAHIRRAGHAEQYQRVSEVETGLKQQVHKGEVGLPHVHLCEV